MQTSQKTDVKDILSQTISAKAQGSARAFNDTIIVSIGEVDFDDSVTVTVGSVGYANKQSELTVGEFILFERNSEEIYEIRLVGKYTAGVDYNHSAEILVSLMHPSHIVGNMSRLNERILWASTKDYPERFTEPEAAFMKAKLAVFETQVNDGFATTKEQADFIHQKLDYLVQALDTQSKQDWFYMSMGIFTSIAMSLGVSAANDDKFWQLIKTVLGIPVQILLGG